MKYAFALLVLATCPLFTIAQDDLVTDRPDQTESAEVVGPGRVQVELGATHTEVDDFVENDAFGELLVRIGISDNFELRVGYDGYNDAEVNTPGFQFSDSGSGDTNIGFKWKMADESGKRPQMALLVGTSLPTGDDAFTSDNAEPSFRFNASHTLSERVGLAYNIGMASVVEEDATGDDSMLAVAQYTLAFGFGLTDRWGAFLEAYGDIPTSASGGPANAVDGGLTFLITPTVQWDMAVGTGISDAAEDFFISTGISFRLGD